MSIQRPQRLLLALSLVILVISTFLTLRAHGDTPEPVAAAVAAPDAPHAVDVPEAPPESDPAPEPTPVNPIQDVVNAHLAGRNACIVVREGQQTLASVAPDTPMAPASAQKVLVAAAALHVFGPEHRFVTEVRSAAPVVDAAVGDLWLVGGGDPFLTTPEYADWLRQNRRFQDLLPTNLAALADAVVNNGVRTVTGRVYADDSRHEAVRYLPSWKASFLTGGSITPLTALTVNRGFATWEPERKHLDDPALHAAAELTRLLRDRGVTVVGEPTPGVAPAQSTSISAHGGATLAEVLTGMLRSSDNISAEMITREIGLRRAGSGTTGAGVEAVRTVLAEMGVNTSGTALVDGSGLDAGNRTTCRTLTETVSSAPGGVALPSMLAIAGHTGTLHHRFHDTPLVGRLRGKTGWINGVVSMTGAMHVGRSLTFTILQNGVPTLADGRGVEEPLLEALAAAP